MADSIIGAGVQGALRGAASGGGMVSAPFKAVQVGGNAIKGIAKNVHSFNKRKNQKSHFKKKM